MSPSGFVGTTACVSMAGSLLFPWLQTLPLCMCSMVTITTLDNSPAQQPGSGSPFLCRPLRISSRRSTSMLTRGTDAPAESSRQSSRARSSLLTVSATCKQAVGCNGVLQGADGILLVCWCT